MAKLKAPERLPSFLASVSTGRRRQVDGTWDEDSLKLEHRGGITYLGTFKLPDNRSSKVQCNDLAMLD